MVSASWPLLMVTAVNPERARSPKNPSKIPNEIQLGLCAAAMIGARDGIIVKNAAGREGVAAAVDDKFVPRPIAQFGESSLDPKPEMRDESDAYTKPVEQKTRYEEWKPEA